MNLQEIRSALQSSDEEVRRSTLTSLWEIPFKDAQLILFTAMGDESWRVRKEAVDRYVSLTPSLNSIEQLLHLLRNEENAGLRNSAAEAVIRLGVASSLPLLSMVHDEDADVRKFIIDVMGAIGDPVFVPVLLEALSDPEVNVASSAAEQLGIIGDTSVSEQLIQAILQRDEVLFRFSALGSLGLLAKPLVVPEALIALADQDILLKPVYECLGSISDAGSCKLLLNGFFSLQKNSRAAAVKSLYKIFRRSTAQSQEMIIEELLLYKENNIVSKLLELSGYRDALLTDSIIWISTVIRDTRFIPLLIEAYADERYSNSALESLKGFGREALFEITSRYSTLDESGRSGLCILIAECGYSSFDDIIRQALHDQSAVVRKNAAIAVGKLGLLTSIPDLITLIDDTEMPVYKAAISSLQSLVLLSRSAIITEVDHFCSSNKVHHRKAAALLLASLGELDSLLLLIKDEEPEVRKTAVAVLGENRVKKSGTMLILALADEDPDVRVAVADALGNLNDSSTLDAMELAINDEDIWVQSALLKAIAKVDPVRGLDIIKTIYTKAEGLLMITILKILEGIGGAEADKIIRFAIQSSDKDIVRQATKSLDNILLNRLN